MQLASFQLLLMIFKTIQDLSRKNFPQKILIIRMCVQNIQNSPPTLLNLVKRDNPVLLSARLIVFIISKKTILKKSNHTSNMLTIFKERLFLQEAWDRLRTILNTHWQRLKNAPDKLLKAKPLKKSRVKTKNFRKNLRSYRKSLVKKSRQNKISVF